MNVIDIMTANPITIRADQTLRAALERMEAAHCKHLPVVSTQGHLIGVLSDRDCRYALNSPFATRDNWQHDPLTDALQVRTVMSAAPVVIEPQAAAAEAARLMLVNRIGCLPVMRAETLVGIVTRSDVLVAFMNVHRRYEALLDNDVMVAAPGD